MFGVYIKAKTAHYFRLFFFVRNNNTVDILVCAFYIFYKFNTDGAHFNFTRGALFFQPDVSQDIAIKKLYCLLRKL